MPNERCRFNSGFYLADARLAHQANTLGALSRDCVTTTLRVRGIRVCVCVYAYAKYAYTHMCDIVMVVVRRARDANSRNTRIEFLTYILSIAIAPRARLAPRVARGPAKKDRYKTRTPLVCLRVCVHRTDRSHPA